MRVVALGLFRMFSSTNYRSAKHHADDANVQFAGKNVIAPIEKANKFIGIVVLIPENWEINFTAKKIEKFILSRKELIRGDDNIKSLSALAYKTIYCISKNDSGHFGMVVMDQKSLTRAVESIKLHRRNRPISQRKADNWIEDELCISHTDRLERIL